MAIASFTSAFADVKVTSLSELKVGVAFNIYPKGCGSTSSYALACEGNGCPLTSYSRAGDGKEWTLEDAGSGYYYLKNELGCYWAYQNNSSYASLTCTTNKSSAVKVKITWDSKNNGVCFWNQKDGKGLNNLFSYDYRYNWYSSPSSYNDGDTNTTFNVYLKLDEVEVDGIVYRLNKSDKTAEVYSAKTYISGNIEIPEYVEFNNERFVVTSLGEKCFEYCSSLTSITLPNSITSLGDGCFYQCASLTSIILPNSITSLGDYCFWECRSLTSITLPSSITSLGGGFFVGCRSLTSITLPNGITSLGASCFNGCSGLTSITLPNGITSLGTGCFSGCSGLASITLPNGITSLGNYCFDGCSSLASITLPNGITSLGNYCFNDCGSLTSITLPSGITSLGNYCFASCGSLTSMTLPNSITSLGESCFDGCSSLASITLPNSITSLGDACFSKCSSLTSITLPNNITSLENYCFKGCTELSFVEFPSTLKTIGNGLFKDAMQEKTIVCQALTPPNYTGTDSDFIDSNTSLFVPNNAIDKYKNIVPWNAAKSIQSIFSLPNEVTVVKTNNIQLVCKANVAGYDIKGLKWTTSNATIASVDKSTGVVTANKVGDAVITATVTDGSGISASTTVHVTPLSATSLSITKELTLLYSYSQKLEATILPEQTDNKTLEWSSDNEDVATVDQDGVVMGVNAGTANIIAKTTDGSNLSDTCKVTVNPVVINLSTNTVNLQKGDTYVEQTTTVLPDNYEHKDVVWTASGNGVASVDANGNITANKPGVDTLRCSLSYDSNIYSECRVIVYDENVVYVGGLYYILHDEDSSDRWATVTSIYGGKNTSLDATNVAQYYSGTISIPETIIYDGKKYTVKKVGNYAFNCQNELQSIYVPRTVTEIESHAAIKAEKLNRVNVADESQLVNIGEEAFKWCTGLKRFTFDGTSLSMSSIDQSAFYGCTALEQVVWKGKSELKTIRDYAFFKCAVLNNLVMPNTTLSVGNSAFRYNAGLTDIHLSTSLNYIDEYAFGECGFSDITLPESLANIQAGAFINNEHLQAITLPERLQGLGSAAFENNSALQSVTFHTAIETMTIGNNAFNQCPVLNKVYITNMNSFAQTNFNNAKANPANTSQHIYDANGTEITKVVLPKGTKYVNNNAFNGCAYIESIEMPSTMDHVNDDIFVGCSALRDVYCYATEVPDFIGVNDPSSMNDVFQQATLHVIYGNESAYKADSWWGRFYSVEGCAAPSEEDEKVTSITISQENVTLKPDDTVQLAATVYPTNAANKKVLWSSSNDDVAMVTDEGFVLAVAEGEADITAKAADGSGVKAVCHIKVEGENTPVVTIVDIKFVESTATIAINETKQLAVTFNPVNASNKTLKWTSAKPAVATVDADGNVTGVSEGKTIITAKTTDGSNLTINCVVTVTKATGIDGVMAGGVNIVVKDRHLTVEGLADDDIITVANIAGFTVYKGTSHEVDLNASGVYIIKVKGKTLKVSAK